MTKENHFKLKKYDSIDECLLASWKYEDNTITLDDLKNSPQSGLDEGGNKIDFSYENSVEGIKMQGIWGWVDLNKTIHFWVGKDLPMEELIHFFAHEIGHRTGTPSQDDFEEEMRAEDFGHVSTLAYKFANTIKSQLN